MLFPTELVPRILDGTWLLGWKLIVIRLEVCLMEKPLEYLVLFLLDFMVSHPPSFPTQERLITFLTAAVHHKTIRWLSFYNFLQFFDHSLVNILLLSKGPWQRHSTTWYLWTHSSKIWYFPLVIMFPAMDLSEEKIKRRMPIVLKQALHLVVILLK